MEDGLVEVKTGSILVNDKKLTLGMNFDEINGLFSDIIKSTSNYRNKEGQDCKIVCFFDRPIYNMPAEIRIMFHDNISYKIYLSYDSNDISVNSPNIEKELYKDRVRQTSKNLSKNVAKYYNIDENNIFCIKENGYKFSSYVNNECTECSAILERE